MKTRLMGVDMFEIFKIDGNITFKELGSWGIYEAAKDRIKEFGVINTSIELIDGIDELCMGFGRVII